MKRIIKYIALGIIMFGVWSCRPMGDDLLSYGQSDDQAFRIAESSFAGEFETFWMAMNENYCIWDYEKELGLDWDEVYDTYLPKFQALDDPNRTTPVSDEELEALYSQFTDSLHDGHLAFIIKNPHTGGTIMLVPNQKRNLRERKQVYTDEKENITSLGAYRKAGGNPNHRILDYDASGPVDFALELLDSAAHRVLRVAEAYVDSVDAAGGPEYTGSLNDKVYELANGLKWEMLSVLSVLDLPWEAQIKDLSMYINQYNRACQTYAAAIDLLGADLTPIDDIYASDELRFIRFALFDGNIAYLRFGGFRLSLFLPDEYRSDDGTPYSEYQNAVYRVWKKWFDAIQSLHASGQLGGVIIDVRNNTGGIVNDYQYVLGALLPSGGYDSHTMRVKNGLGRLDFAPLIPFRFLTYPDAHAVISDRPIVVLANSNSISMAEMTTWGVHSQPNGCFIGTRTYGGLSCLSPGVESYSETYSGAFGVRDVTPIYGYIPKYVSLFGPDRKILEGVGITPDIEQPLDVNLWTSEGRDSQLERALDYIHSK